MWSVAEFGKYRGKGKTLPQILFDDPDWFFFNVEQGRFRGALAVEAEQLAKKARNIRIPGNEMDNLRAEYVIHPGVGKFADLNIVPKDRPPHEGASPVIYKDRIDMAVVREIAQYDKKGGKMFIACLKSVLFGSSGARLTRARCDEFFEDSKNFF